MKIIEGNRCCLEISKNKISYEGQWSSSIMEFNCSGVKAMLEFLRKPITIDGEKIRSFNFGRLDIVDKYLTHYKYGAVQLEMKELQSKYAVYSNNIFQEDIKNMIKLLEIYLNTGCINDVIDVIKKIKQVARRVG